MPPALSETTSLSDQQIDTNSPTLTRSFISPMDRESVDTFAEVANEVYTVKIPGNRI